MILSRCPKCETTFRVTPEQLRARQGMVRCGRCGAAFNALDNLAAGVAPETPRSAVPGLAVPAPEPRPEPAPPPPSPQPAALAPLPGVEIEFPPLIGSDRDEGEAGSAQAETHRASAELPSVALVPTTGDLPTPPQVEAATQGSPPTEASLPEPEAPVEIGAAEEDRPSRWRGFLLGSGVFVLALLALGQLAYLFRQEAAQAYPQSRPLLESFCAQFGCRVNLPRNDELISIETSDLQPDANRKGHLILGATIRNRAEVAQDVPHLELTLTDARDRALARRVFAPADYLPPDTETRAGIAAGAELAVHLVLDAASIGASGYRLYVFYP